MTALQKSSDWSWTIDDVVEGTGGKLIQRGSRIPMSVGTDTRAELEGTVFIALKGDRFDAHDFLEKAAERAAVLVVHKNADLKWPRDLSVIFVDDTLKALQCFGHWHRARWDGRMVAITGTNGKTTTKEFTRILLSQKFPTLATEGSLNNHWGVPLTLLRLRPHHRFAVVEMGMNHHGEINALMQIAEPSVCLVTNVGHSHMEFFSSIEDVALAKEEMYAAARPDAVFIFNLDNPHTKKMAEKYRCQHKSLTFSTYENDCDVFLKEKMSTLEYIEVQGAIGGEPGQAKIPVFGRQNVANVGAASCVALAFGLDAALIWKGLGQLKASWGRGEIIQLASGAKILFDAYNANPESTLAALDNFKRLAVRGKKYLVLGEMREQGALSSELHEEIGQRASEVGAARAAFIGEHAEDFKRGFLKKGDSEKLVISNTYEEKLAQDLGAMLQNGDVVLVKGSRGVRLERVVENWKPLNFKGKH